MDDALSAPVLSPSADQGAAQQAGKLLNGWIELGEEMGRVISLMPAEVFEDWFPDWFGPRLFDLQVMSRPAALSSPPAQEPK